MKVVTLWANGCYGQGYEWHKGSEVESYEGVHGGFGFRERNVDDDRFSEFCNAVEIVVANM